MAGRSLTVQAVLTGMIVGGLLSISNVYVGLRVGFSFGTSISAAVLAVTIGRAIDRLRPGRPATTMTENVMVQTCAGAAGYMAGTGLNSAIPALFMLRAKGSIASPLPSPVALALWVSALSVLGILLAALLRPFVLADPRARFPSGAACAETLKRLHEDSSAAESGARVLVSAAVVGAASKVAVGARRFPLGRFGLGWPSSAVLLGAGALVGLRVGWTLLLTALVEALVVGPWLHRHGVLRVFEDGGAWSAVSWSAFQASAAHDGAIAVQTASGLAGALRTRWAIWPGTAALVGAGLGELGGMGRLVVRSVAIPRASGGRPRRDLWITMAGALALAIALARTLFGVGLAAGLFAGALALVFGAIAARATGETDISPVGPLGKLTQLVLAAVAPGDMTANLMGANLMTGTAAHASELMTDLKTGHLLGASPRDQVKVQLFGVVAGAALCVPAFLALARTSELGGPNLPAPAAVAWRTMAELVAGHERRLPLFATEASIVLGVAAFFLALAYDVFPSARRWLPSPTAIGIALVLDAQDSVTLFAGAALAAVWQAWGKPSASRHLTSVAAGLIAGEALTGVALALRSAMRLG